MHPVSPCVTLCVACDSHLATGIHASSLMFGWSKHHKNLTMSVLHPVLVAASRKPVAVLT